MAVREWNRRQFLSLGGGLALGLSLGEAGWASPAATTSGIQGRFLYVFGDRQLSVYDIDNGHALAGTLPLGDQVVDPRGICFSPVTGALHLTFLGAHPYRASNHGHLLRYDLSTHRIAWRRTFASGQVDSLDVTPDGRRLYVPTGSDQTQSTAWHVVQAGSGAVVSNLAVASRPHDTAVSLDGREVYLGAVGNTFLHVLNTQTGRLRAVGPFGADGPTGGGQVKPFTVNGKRTRAFLCLNGLLGFEVGDLKAGHRLFRVDLTSLGYPWPASTLGPSHGISLSPDERELYVADQPHNAVHVFDVTQVVSDPPQAPTLIATIPLQGTLSGAQAGGRPREGWLLHSLDGRFVYVGDAGDVISTATRETVTTVPTMQDSRVMLEIDVDANGKAIATTSRVGLGRVL